MVVLKVMCGTSCMRIGPLAFVFSLTHFNLGAQLQPVFILKNMKFQYFVTIVNTDTTAYCPK